MIPNLHLLGIQGSGKGTQSALLVEKYALTYLPSGNLFRERASCDDELGREISTQLRLGHLLDNSILYRTVEDFLHKTPIAHGLLCDGLPRTIAQHELLLNLWSQFHLEEPFLICLALSEDKARERIEQRERQKTDLTLTEYHHIYSGKLLKRTDDNPAAISSRFKIYHQMTEPLVAAATLRNRCAIINADRDIISIHTDICAIIRTQFPSLI